MGIHFAYFGLESDMFFEGTTSVYEHIILLSQFQMNKKEKEICEFAMHFKKSFCLRHNLSNGDIISAYRSGLKWVWILDSGSDNGCGKRHFLARNRVRELGGTPPLRIPRSTPLPPGLGDY